LSKAQAWIERRHQRLIRYKGLLQGEARKIMTAKEALAKRQVECDQVMGQRAKLAQAIETVRAQEQKLAAGRERTTALATVFYAVASLLVIGILSWTIVSQTVPATYIARAIVQADTKGQSPGEGDLASWQQYHEELVADPHMTEMAADRFAKR